MLHRLSCDVGIVRNIVDWYMYYIRDKIQYVYITVAASSANLLGYIRRPRVRCISSAPVANIFSKSHLISPF